jgi:hypothetical protein
VEYLHEALLSLGSGVGLWILRRIAKALNDLSRDFHELKSLPERMEKETKDQQNIQGKQIQLLIEKLIEQGPR